MQKIPVLVTSFIRPNFLMSVLEIIEKRYDIDLYFATDGPRNNNDKIKINKCLNIIKQKLFLRIKYYQIIYLYIHRL